MGTASGQSLVADLRLEPYLSQDAKRSLKQSFPARPDGPAYRAVQTALMHLHGTKIPILAGTDAGNPGTTMGASMHRELELMVQSGMAPLEALKACTSVPAEQFNLTDRGRLRNGMRADLVLVNGDPTTDITATRDIVATWVGGMSVDRKAYRTTIAEAKEREAARLAATPADATWSLVSDFENDDLSTEFGAGWAVSTDALRGGNSKATLHRGNGGAERSSGAMRVEGELVEGFQFPWAGAMFSLGKTQMAAADLSSKKEIAFWAKGSDTVVTLMVFTRASGFTPIMRTFPLDSEWKLYTVRFDELNIDGQGLMGLYLGCGTTLGEFTLFIDDVRFD